jgi:hypothetical protein
MRIAGVLLAACGGGTDPVQGDGDVNQLTADSFGERYGEKYCEELVACNPATVCAPEDVDRPADSGCAFDAATAERCLTEEWTCHTELGMDLAFVTAPQTCEEVFDCGATTAL